MNKKMKQSVKSMLLMTQQPDVLNLRDYLLLRSVHYNSIQFDIHNVMLCYFNFLKKKLYFKFYVVVSYQRKILS